MTKRKAQSSERNEVAPPKRLSEVKKWLEAHPQPDAETVAALGKRAKQNAAQAAAAVRALASIASEEALATLASYRPPTVDGDASISEWGASFPNAVAKEILRAWPRFDRHRFAEAIFGGLGTLWVEHADYAIPSMEGIESASGLSDLRVYLTSDCDLEPLGRCESLTRLRINCHRRTTGIAGLSPTSSLLRLDLSNSDHLNQDALDALVALDSVRRLYVTLGEGRDASFLVKMKGLERLLLGLRELPTDELATTCRALLARNVDIAFYEYQEGIEEWLEILQAPARVRGNGFSVLTAQSTAEHQQDLKLALTLNAFLEVPSTMEKHLKTQTPIKIPPIAGGD